MRDLNERPNEKSIYIWNITGSIANAVLSVVALMIVTRILDDKEADIFSIAWTISQLMATIGTFQIRMYQATDVTGVFRFRQYLIYRIITIGIMLASSSVYILVRGYTGEKAGAVLLMCIFRAVDSLADVYEGWFQQKERLDLSGKALTFRIVIGVLGFGVVLFCTGNLIAASIVLIFAYVICFFCYDIRYYCRVNIFNDKEMRCSVRRNWVFRMTIEGFPLFINAFLMMSIMNAPKMVLDVFIAQGKLEQGIQTIFNIIFMPASVLNLAYIVFRPLITRMALVWNERKRREFLRILFTILASLVVIGGGLLVGSTFFGIPVLSVVYAVDLQDYRNELMIIIFGGCIYTFAAVLDNALVVIRRQYILVLAYIFTYIYIKFLSEALIELWGVMGAALAYASAMLVFLIIVTVMFIVNFWHASKKTQDRRIEH